MRGSDRGARLNWVATRFMVSNHGGRQLDHTIATIDALPDVVDAVDGGCRCCSTAASGAAPMC